MDQTYQRFPLYTVCSGSCLGEGGACHTSGSPRGFILGIHKYDKWWWELQWKLINSKCLSENRKTTSEKC